MQKGWIKVYRDLLEKPWANKPNYVSVWFHLHLLMNHKPKEMLYMNTIITVQPGQLITSRASLREKTGVSESTVEKILKFFQKTGEIEQRTNSSFRLITIKNARRYLEKEQRTIQQQNSEVYSEGTADDTLSKNERMKEYNSSKEELTPKRQHSGLEIKKDNRNPDINKMLDALKLKIGIQAFADSKFERNIASNCVKLMSKIGKDEFVRRLESILADNFKRKRANEIVYIYNQIKAFIEDSQESKTLILS